MENKISPMAAATGSQQDPKDYPDAPYLFSHSDSESVSLSSGALVYTTTDLVIPGKNGFDLKIERQYNSANSNADEPTINRGSGYSVMHYYVLEEYHCTNATCLSREYCIHNNFNSSNFKLYSRTRYGPFYSLEESRKDQSNRLWDNGTEGFIDSRGNLVGIIVYNATDEHTVTETTGFYLTGTRDNSHFEKLYGLGQGWRFNFPSIERVEDYNKVEDVEYYDYLHVGDGRAYRLGKNTTNENTFNLLISDKQSYISKDIRFYGSETDGYTLIYKDGRKAYFNTERLLTRMEDRFGSNMYFAYTGGRLSSITDTYGNVVSLNTTQVGNGTYDLHLVRNGVTECTYRVGGSLQSFTDKANQTTQYGYVGGAAQARLMAKTWDPNPMNYAYTNLTKITHPTGAVTRYDYEKHTVTYDKDAGIFKEYYALKKRWDQYSEADSTERNVETYTFSDTVKEIKDGQRHYIYRSEVSKGELKTICSFDNEARLTNETQARGTTTLSSKSIEYGTNLSTDYKRPNYEKKLVYNPDSPGVYTVYETTYTYVSDYLGNVSRLVEKHTSSANAVLFQQTTDMAYGANSILTYKKYNKDAATVIEERYTLSGDVAIDTATIWEGGAVKQKTQYFYDGAWNLTTERRFYGNMSSQYHDTAYRYDQAGCPKPTKTTTGGISRNFTYDAYGRVKTETDGLNTTTYTYDGIGRVTRETYADGRSKEIAYNVDNTQNAIIVTDERGNRTRTDYTTLGKIQRESYINDGGIVGSRAVKMREYSYDIYGRLRTETVHSNGSSGGNPQYHPKHFYEYEYDHLDRLVEKSCQRLSMIIGHKNYIGRETYQYEDAVDGKYFRETKTTYRNNGDGIVTVTTKDQRGNVVSEKVASDTTTYTYDNLGNRLTATDPKGNITRWICDFAGRALTETKPHNGSTVTATTQYDALGNKTAFIDFRGGRTDYVYDALGRLKQQVSDFQDGSRSTTVYEYDDAGNIMKQQVSCNAVGAGAAWRTTEYTYDKRNRVVDTIQKDGGAEYRTRTEYDEAGNKVRVYTGMLGNSTAGAHLSSYEYNVRNLLTKTVDPRSNQLSTSDPLYCDERFKYDTTNQLTEKTDRNGHLTKYEYDSMDRVSQETVTATSARGQTVSTRTYKYNWMGQKTEETVAEQSPDGSTSMTTTYTYDSAGRLGTQTDTADGVTVVKTYGYDANGNRETFTLVRNGATELTMGYRYDGQNRMIEVMRDGAVIATYGYDQNGNRTSLTYPQSGISTSYAYNAANLVTSMTNNRGGVVSSYRYTYYLDGNQRTKTSADGKTVTYLYDGLGRLTRESCSDGSASAYEYDRHSNRRKMVYTGVNAAESYTTEYEYHPNNWLLTETTQRKDIREVFRYQYDKNGNQCYREWEKLEPAMGDSPGEVHFEKGTAKKDTILELRAYNGFDQLTWLYRDGEATFYRYRPDGLRHQKRTGSDTTTHLWDGENIVMELTANGNVKSRFYRGINLIAQRIDANDFYYLFNAHGDVVQRTNAGGVVAKSYEYDAFGVETEPEPLDQNPFRYCGEYFDKESESYYLRARYYDPKRGRFSSEDVAQDGLNWYTYCGNNPICFKDPSGMLIGIDDLVYIIIAIILILMSAIAAVDSSSNIQSSPSMGPNILPFPLPRQTAPPTFTFPWQKEKEPSIETFPSPEQEKPHFEGIPMHEREKDAVYGPEPYRESARDHIMFSDQKDALGYENKTTTKFWKDYDKLPPEVQKTADAQFDLYVKNPQADGLNFEKLQGATNEYSVRINKSYRAYGRLENGVMTWYGINKHDYNRR